MQKIHTSKIYILLIFLCVVCVKINSQENKQYEDVKSTEDRIQELISIIGTNLHGTSVYELFIKEQKIWEDYKDAHIKTLFPDYINGIKMEWGSIVSYGIAQEILKMNIYRIKVLESFLNDKRDTGTDGKGTFKEYVNELRLIRGK